MSGDNHYCWLKRSDVWNTKNSWTVLYAESSMGCIKTTRFKYFFPLVKRLPPEQASFIHNIMTVKYVDTDDLSCKYTANFVASWEICWTPKGPSCAIGTECHLKIKVQSKLIVFGVVRALKKQATQTRDGSQSFHNVSTKVSSVTYVYVQR